MQLSDPIADMLTRIRNAQQRKKDKVSTPSSNLRINVLNVLKEEGYIKDFNVSTLRPGINEISIKLKYFENQPVIEDVEKISKPGRRFYSQSAKIPRVNNGLGINIISTSQGVMTDVKARALGIGGELICKVY